MLTRQEQRIDGIENKLEALLARFNRQSLVTAPSISSQRPDPNPDGDVLSSTAPLL